ncbi:beta-propeller fold lactonase family protein [Wenzhouxiangella sp. AB-CW3]|uniref:beta-propeller fold lactonase family protein n=1 Tax=Wenzhouxiangella sp. AB-CW3 TaxID=2771012 RepID=UPI00168AC188|nr:beta-propeller fold lactonase family protein [Wenzhouxiangella sp. AB-CW3]QOC21318.1 beta-propeller fold lactonase family protein [Wenzhouxiangella sp. AB-CW3]
MKITTRTIMVGLALLLAATTGQARIDQPSHIFYGNATLYGQAVESGTNIEVRSVPDGDILVRYEMGRDPALGDQYALPIRMDDVDPRTEGRARPGDEVEIYIGSQLAAEPVVGAIGRAVRLDIDPQHLGTGPSISIHDTEVLEGDSGITTATLQVEMNTTHDEDIVLEWETEDDTAVGGPECGAGIDFIHETGQIVIPAGALSGNIEVSVCGDTVPQADETFLVHIQPHAESDGVIARPTATVTIIDDDDIPDIRVADGWLNVPSSGTAEMVFNVTLSRSHDRTVSFDWQTQDGSATAPQDYQAASGQVEIEPGRTGSEIRVTVNATNDDIPQKSFTLHLDAERQGQLERSTVAGIIANPGIEPLLRHEQDVVHGEEGVTGIPDPTSVVVSPNGDHVYVTSESSGQITSFFRRKANGTLEFLATIDDGTEGFADVNLDGPVYLVISPDGKNIYVAAKKGNAIVVFARNIDNGELTHIENIQGGEGAIESLSDVSRLHVSADGDHLYASGSGAAAVAVFERDSDNGSLSYLESTGSGGDLPQGMDRPAGLTLSPDGSQLFVSARHGNALLVFDREQDAESDDYGRLTHHTTLQQGLAGVTDLDGAIDVAIDSAGTNLYVAAENEAGMTRLVRDGDGNLEIVESWKRGETNLPGMGGTQHLQLTPDNVEMFVTGFDDHSLTIFLRDDDSDELEIRATLFNNQGNISRMGGPTDMAVSPDNRHLYVVANEDNAIVVFTRMTNDDIFGDGFMSRED